MAGKTLDLDDILHKDDLDYVFDDQGEIQIQCDYCRKNYTVTRNDLKN